MRMHQVTLAVHDMDAATAFYQRLGLVLIVDAAPRYRRFETPGGETVSLHEEAGFAGADWPLVYFEYERNALDTLCAELGLTPQDQRYGWREADIRDPSGNRIRLFHAGDNRRFPPWRVDGAIKTTQEETP